MTTTGSETTEVKDAETEPARKPGLLTRLRSQRPKRPLMRRTGGSSRGGGVFGSFIGTFILVWGGTSVVVAANPNVLPHGPIYSGISIGLAFGFALFAGQVVGGPNAQVNPAETLAKAWPGGQRGSLINILGQLGGAICASAVVLAMFGPASRTAANLGAATPASWITVFTLFIVEALGTAILVASSFVTAISRIARAAVSGATLAVLVLAALPITGGSFNPARSLGPAIVGLVFPSIWIYLFAQIVGGLIGGMVGKAVTEEKIPQTVVETRPDMPVIEERPDKPVPEKRTP